ncbi:MAG TPA: amidohydrolase family protein [Acetobacteraceae bacterium]|nr:amidohydrolase family protein [Acetobacteraceae bacterium]
MPASTIQAIDCDVHPPLPSTRDLLPHIDDYWREHILRRGIEADSFETTAHPAKAPLNCRPDWRDGETSQLDGLRERLLEPFGLRVAICNMLHGATMVFNEDLSAALCKGVNNWVAAELLDRDPRLRASILVTPHSPANAVQEMERLAPDRRFVQVLLPALGEMPLGRRYHWPIYEAAERLGLPIGIHAGSMFRHPPSALGWPSYYLEDYVSLATGFASALNSLVTEGVFVKYPRLKVVLIESGVTWLPGYFWRIDKTWRGVRSETPWVNGPPSEIIRAHVRVTIQPFDDPPKAAQVQTILEQIGCDDMLLFSTDYPHWHFEGTDAFPDGLPLGLHEKVMVENPLATYSRLS